MVNLPMPLVLPRDDGIRPAGPPDACFYCQQKVGQPHLAACVTMLKRVKVSYTFELEIEVPYSWSAAEIESHRGGSSWCANNAIEDLRDYMDDFDTCLCRGFSAKVLGVAEPGPLQRPEREEESCQPPGEAT